MLDGWAKLSDIVTQIAAEEGVHPRTVRRRILNMNRAAGGSLVRSFQHRGPARLHWVNLEALKRALEPDTEEPSRDPDWVRARLDRLEQSLSALRRAYRALRQQLASKEEVAASVPRLTEPDDTLR